MPESQFYTRRGDDGYTGLLGRERVPKYDPRPEAYGTVDEVQAVLGLVRAGSPTPRCGEVLLAVQRDLYALMAELAAAGAATGAASSPFAGSVTAEYVDRLEAWIAEVENQVEMPKEFVVPGDSQAGAALHVARTVTRRAERAAVRLYHEGLLGNELVVRYLNRLSSLLFALAMLEDSSATGRETTLARK